MRDPQPYELDKTHHRAFGAAICSMNLVKDIRFTSFIDALRTLADEQGHGAHETVSFCFYKDEAEQIKKWIKVHGKAKLQKQIICLTAEAK